MLLVAEDMEVAKGAQNELGAALKLGALTQMTDG